MSIPSSGPVSLLDLLTEYGAPARTPLSELGQGGDYVPDYPEAHPGDDIGVDGSAVGMADFLGASDANTGWFEDYRLTNDVHPANLVFPTVNGAAIYSSDWSSEKFVIDIKFKLASDHVLSYLSSDFWYDYVNYYNLACLVCGITTLNPSLYTIAQCADSWYGMISHHINAYSAEGNSGYQYNADYTAGSCPTSEHQSNRIEVTNYYTMHKPSKTNSVIMRFVMDADTDTCYITLMDDEGNTLLTRSDSSITWPNRAGWLCVGNCDIYSPEEHDQEQPIDIEECYYAIGTTEAWWSW